MTRIIIADDHRLIREALKAMLLQPDSDIALAGEAASGEEVITLLEKLEADVVLMDYDMPGVNGIEAAGQVRERFPQVKVLMLSMMDNEMFIKGAVGAGAQGYVLKSSGHQELLHAIRVVAEGEEYFSTDIARMLLRKLPEAPTGQPPGPAPETGNGGAPAAAAQSVPANISPRELEVLRLIAQGYTNTQIGELLFNSRRTIETHRQNLLAKTGTSNTATLIVYAATHGLIKLPD